MAAGASAQYMLHCQRTIHSLSLPATVYVIQSLPAVHSTARNQPTTHSATQSTNKPLARSPAWLPAADWSYACIEYVSSLSDPRNVCAAILYLVLGWVVLAAQPWRVLQEWAAVLCGGASEGGDVAAGDSPRKVMAGMLCCAVLPGNAI